MKKIEQGQLTKEIQQRIDLDDEHERRFAREKGFKPREKEPVLFEDKRKVSEYPD